MTDDRKENLIVAMNTEQFYNGKKCKIINVDFIGDQVVVDYSEDGKTVVLTRTFGLFSE